MRVRASTKIHICARDVGLAGSEDQLFHYYGPLMEALKAYANWLFNRPMNRRFDMCIGREKQECIDRLLLTGRTEKVSPRKQAEELFDRLFTPEEQRSIDGNITRIEGDDWHEPA